jgi:hypothetical protein
MVRKLAIICAVAAGLLCPVTTFAGEGHDHDKHHDQDQHHEHDHWRDHDHDHGHGRHWYHGRWWDYGVGPCWQRTPIGWIWICGD